MCIRDRHGSVYCLSRLYSQRSKTHFHFCFCSPLEVCIDYLLIVSPSNDTESESKKNRTETNILTFTYRNNCFYNYCKITARNLSCNFKTSALLDINIIFK